jgi:hypothetical protein
MAIVRMRRFFLIHDLNHFDPYVCFCLDWFNIGYTFRMLVRLLYSWVQKPKIIRVVWSRSFWLRIACALNWSFLRTNGTSIRKSDARITKFFRSIWFGKKA